MNFDSGVAELLLAAGALFGALAAFGKEQLGKGKAKAYTLGLSVLSVATAFLVEAAGWFK